jgi:hypothetical protein
MREAEFSLLSRGPRIASADAAAQEFLTAGDCLGAVQAFATEALWATLAADSRRAASALANARDAYDKVDWGDSFGPSWSVLDRTVRARRAVQLFTAIPDKWHPVFAWLLAAMESNRRASPDYKFQDWLMDRYGVEVGGTRRLPMELEFLTPEPRPTLQRIFAPLRSILRESVVPFAVGALSVLIGGALLLLTLVLYYFGFDFVLRWAGSQLALPWKIGLFVCLLVLGGIPVVAGSALAGLFARIAPYVRISELELQVQCDHRPLDLNRPLEAPVTIRARWRFFKNHFFSTVTNGGPTDEERYARIFESLRSSRLGASLKVASNWTFGLPVDLRIVVGANSAAAPWEAVVTLLSNDYSLGDARFRMRRTTYEKVVRPQRPVSRRLSVAVWSSAPETQLMRRHFMKSLDTSRLTLYFPTEPLTSLAEADILIIYATPIEATATLGLQVEGTTTRHEALVRNRLTAGSFGQGRIVTATDIVSHMRQLRVCIIQSPPASIRPRLNSDRRDAALMRRICAELFQNGVPAVLGLPPFDEEVPEQPLRELAAALTARSWPRNTSRALVSAAHHLQNRIASQDLPDGSEALEIALDVCLYIQERVDVRVDEVLRRERHDKGNGRPTDEPSRMVHGAFPT